MAFGACAMPVELPTEQAEVARLSGQGFVLRMDGRGSEGPSVLEYSGPAGPVMLCRDAAGAELPAEQGERVETVGRRELRATDRASVNARVVVTDGADVTGEYIYTVRRRLLINGRPAADEVETLRMPPDGSVVTASGQTCAPRP